MEPSARWVRAIFNGVTIADSKQTKLLVERGYRPVYYFPKEDVRTDLLQPTSQQTNSPAKGDASYWTIRVGDRSVENGTWSYVTPIPEREDIKEYFAFYWDAMDTWYEEAEQIFAHPRDPYHRVDVMESTRRVRVVINGETVAETSEPRLLFETHHPTRFYIPPQDVHLEFFSATDKHTRCPYKGQASYWTAKVGDVEMPDIVWSYPNPIIECPRIAGYLSFYNEQVDIYVDGEIERRPSS